MAKRTAKRARVPRKPKMLPAARAAAEQGFDFGPEPEFHSRDNTRLGRELEKLEASNPEVARAAKAYDRTVERMLGTENEKRAARAAMTAQIPFMPRPYGLSFADWGKRDAVLNFFAT